ncbi:MAG: multi-sensor hybrid histidine kinase [Gemmatimonadetes bacterium]|nr:multi-sensor hybrid histidine kinase [Gemmatimonadota bacterium]
MTSGEGTDAGAADQPPTRLFQDSTAQGIYRSLCQASFDALIVAENGILLEVNQEFADLGGYTMEELVGQPVERFVAEESVAAVRERIAMQRDGTYEVVIRRKDGSSAVVEATTKNFEIAGRAVRVAALRDVTQKRRMEQHLRQLQKMEAVGRLAGGVAHDFNNLLTVIISYADLLERSMAPLDTRRSELREIQLAATSAASLTRQLLMFSRQQVIDPRPTALNDVVTDAEKLLRRLIGEDVRLTIARSAEPLVVLVDAAQLVQVVLNLAVNAREAMPTGGTLSIEMSRVESGEGARCREQDPASFAMLSVRDSGVGMDEATRQRIFEPFFTTKELGKGTGLGLATVFGIVKQSGGFICAESEPGKGSTFKIYLPLAPAAAEPASEPARPAPARGTETVLVVEDSPAVRAATRGMLEHYGYTVLEAANGKTALSIAERFDGHIDLLLTDVIMPEMSGRVLAEAFTERRPATKLLYMSGYTDDAILRHGVLSAESAYLQKPFGPDALAAAVRDAIDD